MTDLREQLDAQQAIQDLIAHHAPLEQTLEAICHLLERQLPGARCSVMLFRQGSATLSCVAGPSLDEGYRAAIHALPVGPEVGTCGRAAYLRETVITEDIATDPHWVTARDLAARHELAACFSLPVVLRNGDLAGTLATYLREPRAPDEAELDAQRRVGALVALAVERHRIAEGEQQYRSLFTHHPDAVFSMDVDGWLQTANQSVADLVGRTPEAITGRHYRELIPADALPLVESHFSAALEGAPQGFELDYPDAAGRVRNLEVTYLPIVVNEGVTGVFGLARDITERRRSEADLRLLKRAVENSINGVMIGDASAPDLPLIYVNATLRRMTGYGAEGLLGQGLFTLQGPDTDPEAVAQIRNSVANGSDVQLALLSYRSDGSSFWSELYVSPVRDEDGVHRHFIGVLQDLSAQRDFEARLAYYASHDPLTGLLTRQHFEAHLEEQLGLARRRGEILVVLCIDIDQFKPVNDGLGHGAGDRLLVAIGKRLEAALGQGGLLARFGGDEFIALVNSVADREAGLAIVEALLQDLARPFTVDEHRIHITGSIGITSSHERSGSAGEMIQHADHALHLAKQRGRNTWEWHAGDLSAEVSERITLRRELEDALQNQELELHYQPLVEASGYQVASLEALVRWRHPRRGLIPPGEFIPLAERTGQIVAIGRWVLDQAARDMAQLERSTGKRLAVAVNISPLQFRRGSFVAEVRRALDDHGLAPQQIAIELTEGVLVDDTDAVFHTLNTLREMGVAAIIDDFGTGFSSLQYLRYLPITTVKIDGSFIRDVLTDHRSAAIVQGTITMAHHMGLRVVAEWIESDGQADDLRGRGCDILQGFLFGSALGLDALIERLGRD